MADQLQLRRGTTAENLVFTGAQGEVIVDTDKETLVVHNGVSPGGNPLASEKSVTDSTIYFNDDIGGGSAANAYILSPKSNSLIPTTYADGIQLGFVTTNANTGASTATFAGLGVRSLKYPGGLDPAPGDIFGRVNLVYDLASGWFEIQRTGSAQIPQIRTIGSSVSGNALNVTMAPTVIDFRSPILGSGSINSRTLTSTTSMTVPAGATLGTISGVPAKLAILAIDNAGTVELAITNISFGSSIILDESSLINTVGLTNSSNSANTIYSTTARTGVAYRVVGFVASTQATPGTWSASPTQVQGQGGQSIIGKTSLSLTLGTVASTTTGTAIDFTNIPVGCKRVTISLNNVSTSGTSNVAFQIGNSLGIQNTGYAGTGGVVAPSSNSQSFTAGFAIFGSNAANALSGALTLTLIDPTNHTWAASGVIASSSTVATFVTAGVKALSGDLTRVRLTTLGGTDTFDLGSMNILYE